MTIYILLAALIFLLIYFIYQLKTKDNTDQLSKNFFDNFYQRFPELSKQLRDDLTDQNEKKLGEEKKIIQTDLSNKKEMFDKLVSQVIEEVKKIDLADKDRIKSFSTLSQKLDEQKALTQQLQTTTEGLKNVLSSNQKRGFFGEQIAEKLLKMSGFVSGVSYDKQVAGETSRPDFTIYLPDKIKVNVDAKFPYQNLLKWSETDEENHELKKQYFKLFEQDIRNKIKEVSGRDYINTEEHTVDFVILFIPNESIFSFIYDNYPALIQEAMDKKVVFAGPFSFTAILRMIYQAYENFHFQKNVANIIGYIKKFADEFENYNIGFKEIGTKIESLTKQYNTVNTTRTSQLVKIVNKIKTEDKASIPELHE